MKVFCNLMIILGILLCVIAALFSILHWPNGWIVSLFGLGLIGAGVYIKNKPHKK